MDNFDKRLNILIKENKTKKKVLAEAIGLSPQQISGLSKGKSGTTKPVVRAIADFFSVREEWLEYGTGEMMADAPKFEPEVFYDKLSPKEKALLNRFRHMDDQHQHQLMEMADCYVGLSGQNRQNGQLDSDSAEYCSNLKSSGGAGG